jgi:hypothetical protein
VQHAVCFSRTDAGQIATTGVAGVTFASWTDEGILVSAPSLGVLAARQGRPRTSVVYTHTSFLPFTTRAVSGTVAGDLVLWDVDGAAPETRSAVKLVKCVLHAAAPCASASCEQAGGWRHGPCAGWSSLRASMCCTCSTSTSALAARTAVCASSTSREHGRSTATRHHVALTAALRSFAASAGSRTCMQAKLSPCRSPSTNRETVTRPSQPPQVRPWLQLTQTLTRVHRRPDAAGDAEDSRGHGLGPRAGMHL